MRIAVMSPHTRKNGNTTLAMMLAYELANTGKKTCITHLMPMSSSFYKYYNLVGYEDKTSTPTQIVKILKEGGLSGDDISDYCKQINDNLEAFTNNSSNFSSEDMDYMQEYIAKSFPHEHVVFDVDTDDMIQVKNILKYCDVVVLNINQDVVELDNFTKMKEEISKLFMTQAIVVVVNKYNSSKGTIKETANWMGIKKPNNWAVLHENPWITWGTNHGKLDIVYRKINEKDNLVIDLSGELKKILSLLYKAKVYKDKKSKGR